MCSYLPTYAKVMQGMQAVSAMSVAMAIGVVTLVCGLLGGWLADHHGLCAVLPLFRLACALVALPLFAWLSVERATLALWTTAAVLAAINGVSGRSLFVFAWLGKRSGWPLTPGWTLLAPGLLAFVALWSVADESSARVCTPPRIGSRIPTQKSASQRHPAA